MTSPMDRVGSMPESERLPAVLTSSYPLDRLENLIEDLQPILGMNQPAVLDVDLRALEFVGPTCLALLIAALKRVRDKGGSPAVPVGR